MEVAARMMDLLWVGGLVAVPIAGAVAIASLALRFRPATRHAMWVATLVSLIMPLVGAMVWEMPKVTSAHLRKLADTKLGLRERSACENAGGSDGNLDVSEQQDDRVGRLSRGKAHVERATMVSRSASTVHMHFAAIQPTDKAAQLKMNGHDALDSSIDFQTLDGETVRQSLPALAVADGERTVHPEPKPASGLTSSDDSPVSAGLLSASTSSGRISTEISGFLSAWIHRMLSLRDSVSTMPPVPNSVWLGGVVMLGVIQVARTMRAAGILRLATPASRELLAEVGAVSKQVGLDRAPATYFVHARVSPMIWCGLRPRLLVPEHLWNSLGEDSRRAVLVHELAHLARKDHVLCWVESVLGSLYWWHPIVWWVRSKLRADADASCDAWVTSLLPASRRSYAEALLTTKSFVSTPRRSAGLFLCMFNDQTKVLSRRITMVMTHRTAPKISTLGALAAVVIVGVSAFVMPGLACPPEQQPEQNSMTIHIASAPKASAAAGTRYSSSGSATVARAKNTDPFLGEAPTLAVVREQQAKTSATAAPLAFGMRSEGAVTNAPEASTRMTGPAAGTEPRSYVLPEGKLEALSSLMSREDVPVWVELHDDHIVVYATSEQHKVFESFVHMIHPGAMPSAVGQGVGVARSADALPAAVARSSRLTKESVEALRDQAMALAKNKQDMERETEKLRVAADRANESRQKLREMARELTAQANGMRDEAARDALRQSAATLRTRSSTLQAESESLEKRIDQLENRIRQLEDSLADIEQKVQAVDDDDESDDGMDDGKVDVVIDSSEDAAEAPMVPVQPKSPAASVAPLAPTPPAAPNGVLSLPPTAAPTTPVAPVAAGRAALKPLPGI